MERGKERCCLTTDFRAWLLAEYVPIRTAGWSGWPTIIGPLLLFTACASLFLVLGLRHLRLSRRPTLAAGPEVKSAAGHRWSCAGYWALAAAVAWMLSEGIARNGVIAADLRDHSVVLYTLFGSDEVPYSRIEAVTERTYTGSNNVRRRSSSPKYVVLIQAGGRKHEIVTMLHWAEKERAERVFHALRAKVRAVAAPATGPANSGRP